MSLAEDRDSKALRTRRHNPEHLNFNVLNTISGVALSQYIKLSLPFCCVMGTEIYWLGYGLDNRGSIPYWVGKGFSLLATGFRPVMGHAQPPIQWKLGVKRPGRATDHSPPSSTAVRNAWSSTSTLSYAFMSWCL